MKREMRFEPLTRRESVDDHWAENQDSSADVFKEEVYWWGTWKYPVEHLDKDGVCVKEREREVTTSEFGLSGAKSVKVCD